MKLTADETRALGFIALLIALSTGARLLNRPEPIALEAMAVDVAALESASRTAMKRKQLPARELRPGERIDPNTATVEELKRLPRMTAALAQRIIAERERSGGFRTIQDLDRVRGIGPVTLESWAGSLTLPFVSSSVEVRGAQTETPASRSNRESGGPDPRSGKPATASPLDLNRATAAELEALPGVGPVLAGKIVALRDSLGGFQSVEQLDRVRGIGPAMLAKLRPLVRLGS